MIGYAVPDGYLGMVGKNNYMLFATEKEYEEYVKEYEEPINLEYRKNATPAFIFKRKVKNNG